MILLFGGAYQGKFRFACSEFRLQAEDFYTCTADNDSPEPTRKAWQNLQLFVYQLRQENLDPLSWFEQNQAVWQDKILIFDDIGSGIVPTDPQERQWREDNGRCLQYLSCQAEVVYRLFCGLPMRLKP
ncbi:MAG TPA: bifunctional adenosylcobinamide kinase/adenosylcobinamide-phosphate guanylyltransferase [Bacillota bacterium]|nr:bifunctional adenosylcobinamide kinase/adenosylcobinamide-phosphate guanylyltransferase [Bacillota bacterium]